MHEAKRQECAVEWAWQRGWECGYDEGMKVIGASEVERKRVLHVQETLLLFWPDQKLPD